MWNDPLNWSSGMLPTAADDVTINLTPAETVVIPVGFTTTVQSVTAHARLDVAGALTVTAPSAIYGELDVEGSVTVDFASAPVSPPPVSPPPGPPGPPMPNPTPVSVLLIPTVPPGEELTLLPYLGTTSALTLYAGGDIIGQINTVTGSQTTLMTGELRLAGTGALNGGGWYSINTATLSLNGNAATVNNLFAGNGSVVGGNADMTTSALIAQGATFTGPNTSSVITTGDAHLIAAGGVDPPPVTFDGRWMENNGVIRVRGNVVRWVTGAGVKNNLGADIRLDAGSSLVNGNVGTPAVIENRGTITTIRQQNAPVLGRID